MGNIMKKIYRAKSGINAVSMDNFNQFKRDFDFEVTDRKAISDIVKSYIKTIFNKDEAKSILANLKYHFFMFSSYASAIHWMNVGKEFPEEYKKYPEKIKEYYSSLIGKKESNNIDLDEKKVVVPEKVSPMTLMLEKVNNTIMMDIDTLEDEWIMKKKTDIDLFALFHSHDLKPQAANTIRVRIENMKKEYTDAMEKECEQAVESFSHLSKPEMKRRIKVLDKMLEDLDKISIIGKSKRKPRAQKTITADKQVKSLSFQQSSSEFKLESIHPTSIPGSKRLYTFNTKTKTFTEYVTESTKGFQIKGTTIQNFNKEESRSLRLRKPDQFLTTIMNLKTPTQIDKEIKALTTKSNTPSGRINSDTILLKVFNK